MPEIKLCRDCKVELTPENCTSHSKEEFKPQTYCRACTNIRQNERRSTLEGKEKHKIAQKKYLSKPGNRERCNKRQNEIRRDQWKLLIEKMGGCAVCKSKDLRHMCIDHVHDDGGKRRAQGETPYIIRRKLIDSGWDSEVMKDYQMLCFTHNRVKELKRLESLWTYTPTAIAARQWRKKLNEECYEHLGKECALCGYDEVPEVLQIDHIHDNGAELRRQGEPGGISLKLQFRKQGWPESIKLDYRMACPNCNCGRAYRSGEEWEA